MKQKGIDVSAQKLRNQSNKQQTQINEEEEEEEEEEEIKSSIQGVNLSTEEGNTPEESRNPEEEGLDEEPKKKNKSSTELYCAVCKKKFKSDSQWKNHEKSNKHKENMKTLG